MNPTVPILNKIIYAHKLQIRNKLRNNNKYIVFYYM